MYWFLLFSVSMEKCEVVFWLNGRGIVFSLVKILMEPVLNDQWTLSFFILEINFWVNKHYDALFCLEVIMHQIGILIYHSTQLIFFFICYWVNQFRFFKDESPSSKKKPLRQSSHLWFKKCSSFRQPLFFPLPLFPLTNDSVWRTFVDVIIVVVVVVKTPRKFCCDSRMGY
jgi:hypothetical protein